MKVLLNRTFADAADDMTDADAPVVMSAWHSNMTIQLNGSELGSSEHSEQRTGAGQSVVTINRLNTLTYIPYRPNFITAGERVCWQHSNENLGTHTVKLW